MSRHAFAVTPTSVTSHWNFFAGQLGDRVCALDNAPQLTKQVLIALTLLAEGDIERGMALLQGPADRLPAIALRPSGKHAFIFTECIALAERARASVAIPRFLFSWLEPVEPLLYDLLSGTGHPVKTPVVAGIFVHYNAEKAAGQPIATPQVGAAVAIASSTAGFKRQKTTGKGFLRRKPH